MMIMILGMVKLKERDIVNMLFRMMLVFMMIGFSCDSLAKTISIQATGQYISVDELNESPDIAKDRARLEAKRIAIEKAGVYVESISTVKNYKLVKDKVNTLSARIVKVTKEQFRVENSNDGKVYSCDIEVELDDTVDIIKLAQNKRLMEQYSEILDRFDAVAKENAMLRQQFLSADENQKIKLRALISENEKNLTIVDWINKAADADQRHEYIDAILYLSKAIAIKPEDAYCYECRGGVYCKEGYYEKALADYSKAIEIDSKYASTYNGRGLVYYYLFDFQKAIQDLNKATSIDKDFSLPYINRGLVYAAQEKYQDAVGEITKGIKLSKDKDENYASAFLNRGTSYYQLKQYEQAIKDFTSSIEVQPSMLAHKMRGMCYCSLGRYDECYPDFDKAVSMGLDKTVTDSVVYFMFGDRLKKHGEYEKAIIEYTKAIAIFPANPSYFKGRMECNWQLKKYNDALRDLDRYLDNEPNDETMKQMRSALIQMIEYHEKGKK